MPAPLDVTQPIDGMSPDLWLRPISGPQMRSLMVHPSGRVVTLGRGSAADLRLEDGAVSRKHAGLSNRGDDWFVWDLGSRHGTQVNGVALTPHERVPLGDGDLLTLGPWTFRVGLGGSPSTMIASESEREGRVESVVSSELGSLAQHRLTLLIDFADSIQSATDELTLAEAVLRAAIAGTGYTNAALVRPLGESNELEMLGYHGVHDETGDQMSFSRSLIRAASEGELVRLTEDEATRSTSSHSLIDLGIRGAMCSPVMLGASLSALLYLDTRGDVDRPRPDAAAFCKAISRLCGLALSNLKRSQLEARQRQLEADIESAREAQALLMPPESGEPGGLRYAMRMRPGRFVAGDLFDIFELEDGRLAMFLGDVAAKGVGAGILMATTEAFVHAGLLHHGDVSRAARDVNRYLEGRSATNKFVSLWVGVLDPVSRELEFVDAGHGLWAVRDGKGSASQPASEGGLVLGVEPDEAYPAERVTLEPGSRLVLFSDGVVEQPDPGGEQFGLDRAMSIIEGCQGPDDDASCLFDAVLKHASGEELADDTTIASIALP